MGSHYCIIRYLPNPETGECLNVGVIVFGDDIVRARFVRDWDRLRRFGGGDIAFLKHFAKDIERSIGPDLFGKALTPDAVRDMADRWIHCIRLSQPAGSLLSVDRLLEETSRRFLPEPKTQRPKPRTQHAAVKVAADALIDALHARGGEVALSHLKRQVSITGEHGPHKFPLVVTNGSPRVAANAFSFEGRITRELLTNVKAAAYSSGDVLKTDPELKLAVMMLEPPFEIESYHRAVRMFQDEGSEVVTENEVDNWAEKAAKLALHG